MVLGLLENPDRRFIYVEQAFFQRWWSEQTPAKQAQVQGLVASGQLEFINGGWSMHDEACPSFIDMLDNTHLGQRLIFDSFGVVPKTTWQIDVCCHRTPPARPLHAPSPARPAPPHPAPPRPPHRLDPAPSSRAALRPQRLPGLDARLAALRR